MTHAPCGVADLADVGPLVSRIGSLAPEVRAAAALGMTFEVRGNSAPAMTAAVRDAVPLVA
ncbi:hypothetical protein [Phenylobacterium sp.]|uniref:hypothetical protein n=1 Tax=Phenylobacterium sp. TaxID=1871053 RepID=UPI0027264800|nr:hypothetical protein [Phenylobacterium sp.]MDO8802461.1 hypothetical protein [Phenylobacterium sp.]